MIAALLTLSILLGVLSFVLVTVGGCSCGHLHWDEGDVAFSRFIGYGRVDEIGGGDKVEPEEKEYSYGIYF